ncbi:MAG: 30S ribosomal protein S2 [Coriobacteriales bacterium]|jgi:small subunit ribosomal protein S2
MEPITIKTLLDAGVHFGHQTRRWNPKMKPYIFTDRNGIYILDLKQTMVALDRTYSFVAELTARGGKILFVGTKKQAQATIAEQAERCKMPYVNSRWLGGMLTNFVTINERVKRMTELEAMDADGRMATLPKKEQIKLHKELDKLQTNLNGIRDMKSLPDALFVVDTKREEIAVKEANRLGIPVVGMLDTNADPDEVEYGIPSNDDAIRSIALVTELIAEAAIAGEGAQPVDESDFTDEDAEGTEEAAADESSEEAAPAETAEEAPAEGSEEA